MDMRKLALCICVAMVFALVGCSKQSKQVSELKRFPIENLEGLITQSGVQIDKEISSDGNGSLKITASEPIVVRLFETDDIDIEDARLIYQAKVRTKDVEGQVYLRCGAIFLAKASFSPEDYRHP